MTSRDRVLVVFLWLAVIADATWIGGTLYQMAVIVPLWSALPPESVRAFFQETDFNRTIWHFFGPPFIVARAFPVAAALLVGWHLSRHRRALLLALGCTALAVGFTLFYMYPINSVLFMQAGGDHSAAEIQTLVDKWIFADRLRFVIGFARFCILLWVFKLPLREPGVS